MESTNMDELLEAYFEGNTTLEQEAVLREYFTTQDIAPHLKVYAPLFNGFVQAKQEQSSRDIVLPNQARTSYKKWIGIAASASIVLFISVMMYQQNTISTQEKEALVVYNETKKALLLLSKNFNKGTEELVHLNQFTKTKNKYFKQ